MDRPPLDTPQLEAALHAYWSAREQAWRYVLGAVDPSAYNAPALPMLEVLTRVQALVATELVRYTPEPAPAEESDAPAAEDQEGDTLKELGA